jgi:two-component system sensor histidine kinase AtoS
VSAVHAANPESGTPLLEMRGIRVNYGQVQALRGIEFDLYTGEIHALVGAHRAGKSSLVKLLSGAVRKAAGEIFFEGRRVEFFTPQSAIRQGIGTVYQQLSLIPTLTATENIFAGRMLRKGLVWLSHRRMSEAAREVFSRLRFPVDTEVPVNRLSAAEQHMVELARVLFLDPRILILDEVSSKLTPQEMERIYPLLLQFRHEGKSVIYISHNMDEIFEFADRVTILKEGLRTDTSRVADLDRIKLLKLTYSFFLSREELNRQNMELYTLKRYNENIIRNIPVGVIILNAEQRIYLINYAAVEILGLEGEPTDQSLENLIGEADLPDKALILQKIRTRGEMVLKETRYKQEKVLKVSVFPFKDEDYAFLGTIILMEDISKEHSLHDYLLRAEKIASTAELAAGVAHEINNPLGIVQNYLELLKLKDLDLDAQAKLAKIEHEVTRIEKIIGSLLSFSRFSEVSFVNVDVTEVLREVVLLTAHWLAEKRIRLEELIPPVPALVVGDENKLQQLFINLLVNSIEAVPSGGRIRLALAAEAGSVEVTVSDNGCGIAPQVRDRIFDPFFSTKKSKKNAGLGLSISQHIVELHKGVISCTSRGGEGASFRVRLPAAPPK